MSTADTDLFAAPVIPCDMASSGAGEAVDPVSLLTPEQAFASVDPEPLSETLDALKRIPEAARGSFERAAARLYRDLFLVAAAERIAEQGSINDPARSMNMVAHSVKVTVLSAVTSASCAAWHLADSRLIARICADVDKGTDMDSATCALRAPKPVSLFVAAVELDDRESYLKSVASLVKRHKARDIVLDAELIEWFPEADFLAACEQIGVHPLHIGIADKTSASRHSIMSQEGHLERVPALYVNSEGKQLTLDSHGCVQLLEAPAVVTAPVSHKAPSVTAASAITADNLAPVAPNAGIQSRIQALRASQSRRSAARP